MIVSSVPLMKHYMRSIYGQTTETVRLGKRKKRHMNSFATSRILSEDMDMIISLPNLNQHFNYYFDYHGSLENLAHVELILPIKNLSKSSNIILVFKNYNLSINHSLPCEQSWIKLNLTDYVTSFPQQFTIQLDEIPLLSSTFLTLYFQRSFYSRTRRDLSLSSDDVSSTSSDCQVRPYRLIFAELNWTSWIIEPTSYEMNLCSGSCSTTSPSQPYFTMQTLLNGLWPKTIAAPCCRPKRFSSTILLYYDGPNLILKRFENMRVVQCTCS